MAQTRPMRVHEFRDDDAGYLKWRDANPNCNVINVDKSLNLADARLHEVNCTFLIGPIDQGLRLTDYPKICGSTVRELTEWAIAHWGEPVRDCAACRGGGGDGAGGDRPDLRDGGLCPTCFVQRPITGKCSNCD